MRKSCKSENYLRRKIECFMDLGQVFTRREIADYMVSLFNIDTIETILDPCFGEGVFIHSLLEHQFNSIQGYEIDPFLFEHVKKNKLNYVELFNSDFLLSNIPKKYSGIIMNPPYIRHEKINDLNELGITKKQLSKEKIYEGLPLNANIYMYFVIKAISLLKPNGELVIIFPSNWLQSKHGIVFKKLLLKDCSILKQVSIKGQLFEQNALVEVVVLKLVKAKVTSLTVTDNLIFNGRKLVRDLSDNMDLDVDFPDSLTKLAKIRRGLTTGYNKMYINPPLNNCEEYIFPIISSPKSVVGYSTKNAHLDQILILDKYNYKDISSDLNEYLNTHKKYILFNKSPKTLFEKIKANENNWFKINKIPSKGIIFGYFIRDEIKFIIHDCDSLVRDNFYIIEPNIDKLLMLALLNNYYCYYQLEKMGKEYGGGLLKLQKYDLEHIKFPNIETILGNDIENLKRLGKKLMDSKSGYLNIIDDITKVIANYSSITYEVIKLSYIKKKSNRLKK